MFKVIVLLLKPKKVKNRWINAVSYPASGQSLYTRENATKVLERFKTKGMEAYAESINERFDLDSLEM